MPYQTVHTSKKRTVEGLKEDGDWNSSVLNNVLTYTMGSEAKDKITELFESLHVQGSLPPQRSGGGSGNTKNVTIGPNYIYAPGGPGGSGGGGGGGGFQVGGSKAIASSKMTEHKAVIEYCTMPYEMKLIAVDCAKRAMEKYDLHENYEKMLDVAEYIAKEFEKKYTPRWHCLVGTSFTCYVSPDKDCYINFVLGEYKITLFKSG